MPSAATGASRFRCGPADVRRGPRLRKMRWTRRSRERVACVERAHTMTRKQRALANRFWEKVDRAAGDDACWMWTGSLNGRGYGKIGLGSRHLGVGYAHRVSYEINVGDVPPGLQVCHRCDRPSCVRPSHLFVGTALENTQDCVAKGRARRGVMPGERNGRAKVGATEVAVIRMHPVMSDKQAAALATELDVSPGHIKNIHARRTWRHIP